MSAYDLHGHDFPDRGPAVFAVVTATLVLASVFVVARLVSRVCIVHKFGWDDRMIVLSWVVAFGLSFTIIYGVGVGLGRHDADITPEHMSTLRRCEYVFSILYNPALMATKTSILIFYLGLSKNTQPVLRAASWVTLGVVNLAGTVLTLLNIFQCRPVDASWSVRMGDETCIPLLTEFICAAPINIVTDLAILALPIPVLTGMRLPTRQKVILIITFSLGIFVTVVDVVRIYYLQQAISEAPTGVSTNPQAMFGGQADFSWNASLSLMWSAVEVNIGMACACIPTLKPLILKIFPAMLFDPDGTRFSSDTQEEKQTVSPTTARPASDSVPLGSPALGGARIQPLPPSHPSASWEDEMDMMDFLTSPYMVTSRTSQRQSQLPDGHPRRDRSGTVATATTFGTGGMSLGRRDSVRYFGFVDMQRPKSMLRCSAAESWRYCSIVTILFLVWGMSYGMLNILNSAAAAVAGMTTAQTLGLTSAYFGGGYFFGPLLVGEWILRRDEHHRIRKSRDSSNLLLGEGGIGGFKVTFITGLCIYGVGTIIFWPSAVTNSWGGFMLSNFVVGFGLSVLETGANAFIILCGPPAYGEARLLAAQAVQAIGSVASGVLAQKVFFAGLAADGYRGATTLINVQWTYLAVTLACTLLALFFYYMPLPEVGDAELAASAARLPVDPRKRSWGGLQLRTWSLALAVLAQYTYVAAQESNNIWFRSLCLSLLPGYDKSGHKAASGATPEGTDPDQPFGLALSIPDFLLVAHSAFALSRLLAAWVAWKAVTHPRLPRPRTMLVFCGASAVLFAILTVALRPANPNLIFIPVALFFFAEGPCWPLIFAMGLRGQGRRTKRAAAFITMGASGPAFFPFVLYGIVVQGGTVQTAYIVVVCLMLGVCVYPLFLIFVRDAGTLTDPASSGLAADADEDGEGEDQENANEAVRRRRRSRRASSLVSARAGFAALADRLRKGRHKREGSGGPRVEHAEDRGDPA